MNKSHHGNEHLPPDTLPERIWAEACAAAELVIGPGETPRDRYNRALAESNFNGGFLLRAVAEAIIKGSDYGTN